jgi:hypothetical protein
VQRIAVFLVGAVVYPLMPDFEILLLILLRLTPLAGPVLDVGSSPFDQPVVRRAMGD